MNNDLKRCHLARLPYELRQRIFRHALQQPGTVGLQTPVWDDGSTFTQPLFVVCESFRDEALEAFYKTNSFLWHVNRTEKHPDARPDSDPSHYPLQTAIPAVMTPSLPWHYPRLMKDLRYLVLNVHVPSQNDTEAWSTTLPEQLERFVTALDKGSKLKELLVTIISRGRFYDPYLPDSYKDALLILGKIRVDGNVKARTRGFYKQLTADIRALYLDEQIRV